MATPTNLPAAFTVGQVLTSTQQNDLRGAFRVLQVVSAVFSATIVSNSTTTMADTLLTATITPQSNTSKILVILSQTFGKTDGNANNAIGARIVRGSTAVHTFSVASLFTGTAISNIECISATFLDSPATTSATTYKTQFANFTAAAAVSANTNNTPATITLLEISA